MTLQLIDVVKHFHLEKRVVRAVDGVNLTVESGELCAVYGRSGSGKSTLLLLAAGLTQPDRGTVHACGLNLADLSQKEAARFRRNTLGLVLQSFHLLLGATVVENVATKPLLDGMLPPEARRRGDRWLKRLGIGDQRDRDPTKMSAGERQRIAIARALAYDPKLVLADEPTAHLDTEGAVELLQILKEVCRDEGIAMLLATHDADAVDIADRTYRLRDGQLEDYSPARRAAHPSASSLSGT
jgi:putative ABC transport system ATP-binding protein